MKSAAIGSLLIVFLVMGLTITATPASAIFPKKPHKFWGTATLNGDPIPGGSKVTARAGGNVVASTKADSGGFYALTVKPKYTEVSFYVKGKYTGTDHSVVKGEITNVDLSIKDEKPPEVKVKQPKDGELFSEKSVTVKAKVTDKVARHDELKVKLNGKSVDLNPDGSFSKEVTLEPNKPNDVTVTAADLVGKTSSKTVTVTSDPEPPSFESFKAPAKSTDMKVTVSGKVTDEVAPAAKLEVTLLVNGNAKNVTLKSDYSFSKKVTLRSGTNTLRLKAADEVGNSSKSSKKTVLADGTSPSVDITNPNDGAVLGKGSVKVKGTISDDIAGPEEIKATLNGKPLEIATGGTFEKTVDLSQGKNKIEVAAKDQVGNKNSSTVTVTSDTKNPSITLEKPEEGLKTKKTSVTVKGSVSDEVASPRNITVKVNGNKVSVGSDGSFSTAVDLSEVGKKNVTVTATDEAGNTATATRTPERVPTTNWPLYAGIAAAIIAIILAGIAIWRRRAGTERKGM